MVALIVRVDPDEQHRLPSSFLLTVRVSSKSCSNCIRLTRKFFLAGVMDIRPEVIKYFLGRSCTGLIVEFNDLLIPLGPHPVEESWVNSDVCTFLSEWHSNLANLIESSSDSDRSLKLATSKLGRGRAWGECRI